jgi:multiple sugar transport system ATP-binding protein
LRVRLGNLDIIEALNLEVVEGEFLVLLGPSGCGKSTLLHAIAGLIDVADGEIEIAGQNVTWADPKDRSIGMVFQSYALYPTMTVERNMSFGLRISGTPKDEINRRVKRAAEILHLQELLDRKPAQLSGGQRQRVAIGRALVREAAVFLFDEPLSNLDAKLRAELRRELKHLHKEIKSTMLYVTHDQVEAMTLASRIAVMYKGHIQQIDTPSAIYGKPANMFVAGFLGSPSMNFIEGNLDVSAGTVRFSSPSLVIDVSAYAFAAVPVHGQRVTLGFRPEDVNLLTDATAVNGRHVAKISLLEPMGSHMVIWLDHHGQQFSANDSGVRDPVVDQPISFAIDTERISLFDVATQQRI